MSTMIWSFDVRLVVHVNKQIRKTLNRIVYFLDAPLANREFHEQYNPPPAGSSTGFNGQEQVFPTKDTANDMEQLQHRISQFQESYPRIEKFYNQYSKVVVVDEINQDSALDEEQLYHEFSRSVETYVDEEQAKIRQAEEEKQRQENERLEKERQEEEAKRKTEEEAQQAREAAEAVRRKQIARCMNRKVFLSGCRSRTCCSGSC